MSRYTLGAYFELYLVGLRKPVLLHSKGYIICIYEIEQEMV